MLMASILAAAMLNPTVTVECEKSEGWTFSVSTGEVEPGVLVAKIRATAPVAAPPPTFAAVVSFPQIDIAGQWNPNFGCSENLCFLPLWGNVFNVARTQLVHAWLDSEDRNRLTLAAGELRREITFGGGLREEDFRYYAKVVYFAGSCEPLTEYETLLRMDRRPVSFDAAVRDAAAWQSKLAGGSPAIPPPDAYEPLYSTWYNFHKDVTDKAVEAELSQAAALGMKVAILDDGWQCDDIERSYQSCGDWVASPRRFPNMRAHVNRAHALGMKYMVWFSMPFVGEKTVACQRLRGKFLRYDPHLQAHVIDPRFPECRAYLRDVYVRCLKDWGIDGFKLDFVDAFGLEGGVDPAIGENYAGRDCRAISEGVERLLREVTESLSAIKPSLLFEFRQAYVGPVIRKYGNMMRVGDCPGSLVRNRVHIANMRLLCGGSAVHSDMLRWNEDETPEAAQRFILSSIFGVVQYSVMLRRASEEMREMIGKWIAFAREHRETLLFGEFRPHFPRLNYPVVEAESAKERIVVIYDSAVKFDIEPTAKPTYVIDGVTGAVRLLQPTHVFGRSPNPAGIAAPF